MKIGSNAPCVQAYPAYPGIGYMSTAIDLESALRMQLDFHEELGLDTIELHPGRIDLIQNGKRTVDPADLLGRSVALSCFLCCPLCWEDTDSGFLHFLSRYYSDEIGRERTESPSMAADEDMPGIYRKTPDYVSSFIEQAGEGLPDWWEHEFGTYLEGINSLVVYDARNKE